jgi:hypothetical protein
MDPSAITDRSSLLAYAAARAAELTAIYGWAQGEHLELPGGDVDKLFDRITRELYDVDSPHFSQIVAAAGIQIEQVDLRALSSPSLRQMDSWLFRTVEEIARQYPGDNRVDWRLVAEYGLTWRHVYADLELRDSISADLHLQQPTDPQHFIAAIQTTRLEPELDMIFRLAIVNHNRDVRRGRVLGHLERATPEWDALTVAPTLTALDAATGPVPAAGPPSGPAPDLVD